MRAQDCSSLLGLALGPARHGEDVGTFHPCRCTPVRFASTSDVNSETGRFLRSPDPDISSLEAPMS